MSGIADVTIGIQHLRGKSRDIRSTPSGAFSCRGQSHLPDYQNLRVSLLSHFRRTRLIRDPQLRAQLGAEGRAPAQVEGFGSSALSAVLRVTGLSLLVVAVRVVPDSLLRRRLEPRSDAIRDDLVKLRVCL